MDKKRDHHYVFQAYLKRWTNANEKLWCLRGGSFFEVKPRNIAFEKDFYRITPLNDKEKEFIMLFFRKSSEGFKKELKNFLNLYTTFDQSEKHFHTMCALYLHDCPEINLALNEIDSMIDVAKNNALEDTFAVLEGEACAWLDCLCDGNVDFFYNSDDDQNERFISFICTQYYRTKRMKDVTLNTLKQAEECFINDRFPKGCMCQHRRTPKT